MAPPRTLPTLDGERLWWSHGARHVAGVDEVGRGALAGPLIAAAVILPATEASLDRFTGVADSKLLSPEQRDAWFAVIQREAVAVGVGVVESCELDDVGLGPANRLAMERAVYRLPIEPDVVFLDAAVTELSLPQVGLIDGDARCLSIAAASIIAKVTRDRLMIELAQIEHRYGFAVHKGYGTAAHLTALREHGPCAAHRRCFAPVSELLGAS
jgi:ribonuclease HII